MAELGIEFASRVSLQCLSHEASDATTRRETIGKEVELSASRVDAGCDKPGFRSCLSAQRPYCGGEGR